MKVSKNILLCLLSVFMLLFAACGEEDITAASSAPETEAVSAATVCETQSTVTLPTIVPAFEPITTVVAPSMSEAEAISEPLSGAVTETAVEPSAEPVTETATEPQYRNPLTNQVIASIDELPVRPVAVSIGNNSKARPQAGLSYADIVYEVPAEGGVSRYIGIFYGDECEKIGPCRSARPYIVRIAAQFKAALAHVGGSVEALELLDTGLTPNLDEFANSSTFWRSKDRKAPDNCYTSTDKLHKWYEKHDYTVQRIPEWFSFLTDDEQPGGEACDIISVKYISAKNEFRYNAEDDLYYRYISGSQQVDPEGDIDICCANVIVQYVNSKVLDDEGRLAIDLLEGGKALYFIGGKVTEGRWERADDASRTVFLDAEGSEMKFATGKTWIEMADKTCKVEYTNSEAKNE